MTIRQQLQDVPSALRKTLEKARTGYSGVAHEVRWGDGPVLVCGEGECSALAQAASYAFESFPGWPVVAHCADVFQTYALPLLKPRSVLILISAGENQPETEALAQLARERGCVVVLLANSAESPLAKHAQHTALVGSEGKADSPSMTACLHAALNFLALEAALARKRPEAQWNQIKEEFAQLPEKLEWLFNQLQPIVRSFAEEITKLPGLDIVGGGYHEFPAQRACSTLKTRSSFRCEALEPLEFVNGRAQSVRPGEAVLFLSGSHSKVKKLIHRGAGLVKTSGGRVFSLTDGNDRELVEGSDLGLLLPTMHEVTSSTMTLFMMEWVGSEVVRVK